jgi:hypothetical protein
MTTFHIAGADPILEPVLFFRRKRVMETVRSRGGETQSLRWLTQKAWSWLMATTVVVVGCQHDGPFPDVPLFQAKKPIVGSKPRPGTDVLALAEPDMPCCSPAALAQLPAPPEAIAVAKAPPKMATMPHPDWLDAISAPPAVASQISHQPNKTGVLVSRNKKLPGTTERLRGILSRDQNGHYFLLCPAQQATAWDRVQLLDYGQLNEVASGTAVLVTGTWDESLSAGGQTAFHVQHIEKWPDGGKP